MAPRRRRSMPTPGTDYSPMPEATKRGRGRPGKSMPLLSAVTEAGPSRSSTSSATTTPPYESAEDYATPDTSYIATPADRSVADKSELQDVKGKGKAKIEIVLPETRSRRSLAYDDTLSKSSKAKGKQVMIIPDSDGVDDDRLNDKVDEKLGRGFASARDKFDEEYARKLQAELYDQVPETDASSELSELDEEEADDSDVRPLKSRANPDGRMSARTKIGLGGSGKAKLPVRKKAVPESDLEDFEVDDSEDDEDFELDEPAPKRQRVAGGGRARARAPKPRAAAARPRGGRATRTSGVALAPEMSLGTEDESEFSDVSRVEAGLAPTGLSSLDDSEEEGFDRRAVGGRGRRAYRNVNRNRLRTDREKLEEHHPEIKTMWKDLEDMPVLKAGAADQPKNISRTLKPFQREGLAWMLEMERSKWKGGLLGDEMGLGKTIQAVSLIMSDYPAGKPSLVLVPPVALMQWVSEIESYTDGTLKTLVHHGTNAKSKGLKAKDLAKFDVILMSYNSLESMYRKQEKGFSRKDGIHKEKSIMHSTQFHRVILDEAHSIKTRTTMTAKATFALKMDFRWCLSGTPLQNRIGEFFSLIRFLNVQPFSSYFCKECPCSMLEWAMDDDNRCKSCKHHGMQHVSVFNQELLNPIQRHGNFGPGAVAFKKLRLMTDRIMLRRLKKDHTDSMELPVKEIHVNRQFFGEEENDFANSIMTSGQRKFDTYVAQGVMLNNYANIFGLIMQMRQVADHPDLILKKNGEGGQNVMVCCICDEPAEEAIQSRCRHDFCRSCAKSYLLSQEQPDCPRCHIPLSIDLEQPDIVQDESLVKKTSIINRIKMENWTSSSKIELLVRELYAMRSDHASQKSIIFSQFTTMLQLIEWRLRRAGISTVMLDGSMTPAQRASSIDYFMKNAEVECFLVSLKAGGVALNLTEASRVFIVDPWWNPAAEWQSADRCHRIGQTRPCHITRLCIEDSVESRMVLLQEKKTNMINSTINSDDAAMESLTPEDLQFLFRGT